MTCPTRHLLHLCCCAGLAMSSAARDLYVGPEGADDAPGTREQPWRSLSKVNAEAGPGDTVHFLPGEYSGTLSPERGGEPGRPLVFRAVDRHRATLAAASAGGVAVRLEQRAHVVLSGLHITGRERSSWFQIRGSDHIVVDGCRFDLSGAGQSSLVRDSEHLRFTGNTFSRDQFWGNMLDVQVCSQVLFEGNAFTRAGHCPLQITQGQFIVIRANCFHNDWGRNFEFWSSGRLLVEGNVVTEARDSAGSADSRAKNLYHDAIVRFNRIYRNRHTPMNSSSYFPMGAAPTSHHREPFRLVNSRIYNNTLVDNLGQAWQFTGLNISQNHVFNNILYHNDKVAEGCQLWIATDISRDNRFANNLISSGRPDDKTVRYGDAYLSVAEMNARRGLTAFWAEFSGGVDADPRFRDQAGLDYRLQPDSPAIDAGRPLAIAIGAGRGAVLPVSDGIPFYDGFGIEGEAGDWIAVGRPDQRARVLRVELRYYQPARLHLDREVEWTDGAPVSLPWSGAAPDIGAFEHGLEHPARLAAFAAPADARPGQAVRFTLDSFGSAVEAVEWDFGDGRTAAEREPAHAYDAVGHYPVNVRARLAGGAAVAAVVFVKVVVPAEDNPPLAWADFEESTRWDWGYHFKFYRNDLTAWALVDGVGHRGSRCVHLSADQGIKSNQATCKIAPGEWDLDAYPIVRFAYRIPPGVPVAIALEPFVTRGLPRGVVVGGTPAHQAGPYVSIDRYRLVDDGEWHTLSLDARVVREAIPDLRYLRMFLFHLGWGAKPATPYEFWFDDFAIEAAERAE